MKAKVNSDALQRFLVEHGEKIVFGGLAAAFVYFVYSFVVHEQFDRPPEALTKLAQDAQTHIAQSALTENPLKYEDPTVRIQLATVQVPVDRFVFDRDFIVLGRVQKAKRKQPELIAVADLRAKPDFGAIAVSTREDHAGPRRAGRGGGPGNAGGAGPGNAGGVPGGAGGVPGGAGGVPGGAGGVPGGAGGVPGGAGGVPGGAGGVPGGAGGVPGGAGGIPGGAGGVPGGAGGVPGGAGGVPGGAGGVPGGAGGRNRPGAGNEGRDQPAQGREKLADTKAEGRRWVCVTGVVPFAQQQAAFNKVFRDALGAYKTNDVRYAGYYIERAEVVSDELPAEEDWVELGPLSADKIDLAIKRWSAVGKDLVDSSAIDEVLTFPLPMLLSREWGAESAHPAFLQAAPDQAPAEEESEEAAPEAEEDPFAASFKRRDLASEALFCSAPETMAFARRQAEVEVPDFDEAIAEPEAAAPRTVQALPGAGQRMFRFFDLKVEPGKRYRYRVRLVFHNPNFGVQASMLEDPESAKAKYIVGEWSAPSPIVLVPQFGSVFAGGVKPPKGAVEPKANVIVDQWQAAEGVSASVKKTLSRGQLADFSAEAVKASDPMDPADVQDLKVDFQTGAVLVDLRGGETLPGTRTADPGELLMLDPSGRLVIRTQLDDAGQYGSLADKLNALDSAGQPKEEEEEDDDNEFKRMMEQGGAAGGAAGGPGRRPRGQ